jgi:hypothetical protein
MISMVPTIPICISVREILTIDASTARSPIPITNLMISVIHPSAVESDSVLRICLLKMLKIFDASPAKAAKSIHMGVTISKFEINE